MSSYVTWSAARPVALPRALRNESRWSMASILNRPAASARRTRFTSLPLLTAVLPLPPPRTSLRQRDGGDPVSMHGDHVADTALFDQLNGGVPNAGGQDAVKHRRRSAALQ